MNRTTDRIAASGNGEPRVGIFWLLGDGSLLVDSTPLAEAEPYGECLTHPRSHIDQWAEFQRNAIVPRDIEYEEMPRGRVVYDARQKRFTIYGDRCILRRKATVRKVMLAMSLAESQTETSSDPHYRCSRCLLH
jgi:hypothetical protein